MSSFYTLMITTFRLAFRQLNRHKVRSLLTMLGILIGVGSVVSIVSLGEGLRGMFNSQIASQSAADLIYIMPDVPMQPGRISYVQKPFKNRDLDMVRESEYVEGAIGGHILSNVLVKHDWRSSEVMCQLVPPEYFPLENWELEHGRLFTKAEQLGNAMVCVVGAKIHEELYEENEPLLDSHLIIKGQRFRVIGELAARSALEGGDDANLMVFVPLNTGQNRLVGSDDIYWIAAKITDSTKLQAAKEDIASRLRASRRIRSGADDDFSITTPDEWADFANTFVNTLIAVFGVVALISLVVGGIGVMNIMLVNVRERTREIGLRKALGATAGQITWQFLIEAITLTVVGGITGLLLGYLLGYTVSLILKGLFDVFWMPSVPISWILIVIFTSTAIGLAFGVYPAWRAGKLDPITALRYE
jgi:putative ABC transport system permease protein